MTLSEYERRMWAEIEARLIRERRQFRSMGRVAQLAGRFVLGLLIVVAAGVLAVLLGDAMIAALALVGTIGPAGMALIGCGAVAGVLLLRRARLQRS